MTQILSAEYAYDEKGTINRYVLSGDLVIVRETTAVEADGSKASEKSFYHLDHLNSTKVVRDGAVWGKANYPHQE